MSNDESWAEVHAGEKPNVKVYKVIAGTHTEMAQRLLGDPLGLLEDRVGLNKDKNEDWHVQLQIANAAIPTGPLPLPDEIPEIPPGVDPDDWLGEIWRVIRKIIGFLTVLEDLKIVIVVVARVETTREDAKRALEKSRKIRAQNQASQSADA
ncbi:MAG TPA: hypothetical protein VFQ71_07175 [Gaiellales bacterium]|jgi:hypothetical protein|nr:hypothetical protein [Gaiellales bacterium]